MKQAYEQVELEIVRFDGEDVITASGELIEGNDED